MVPTASRTSVDDLEFALDEPPTFPQKLSGGAIKAKVVQAFSEQVAAEAQAHKALDALIHAVRQVKKFPVPERVRKAAESQRPLSLQSLAKSR